MDRLRRFAGVRTIVVGEYLAAAALLVALVHLANAAARRPRCVDTCAGDGLGLALFATAGLVLLVLGLPIALVMATLRQRRQKQQASSGRPTVDRSDLATATLAAASGLAIALPLSCLLAVPVLRLLL